MNIYKNEIMNYIMKENYTNQRIITENTNFSLGIVNKTIRELCDEEYLTEDFFLTEKAYKEFERKKPKNAIILAAGYGMRMVPINTEIPKGLLEVQGETLIERLIRQLHEVGIFQIDIVVGFLKEKYEYLIDAYGVKLIYNPDYAFKSNIHSLNRVIDKVSNTYIIPCDIWIEKNPFSANELYSWYSVTDIVDDESTVRINRKRELIPIPKGKGGNTMIGISYLLEEDATTVRTAVKALCNDAAYDESFWEEALFYKDKQIIYAKVYSSHGVVEINTYEQLRELDEQSNSLNTEVMTLIAEQFAVEIKDVENIDILKKGMTNRSFKFSVKEKQYIMRVPGEGTEQLINRLGEYNVYKAMSEYNLGDKVIFVSPDTGYKITEYWDDARVCDPYNINEVKDCMKKLRDFHDLKLTVEHTFDLYERIDFYESLWNGNPSIFKDYLETKRKVKELKGFIDRMPKEWILTHIDAVPDNFLFVNDKIYLIDWEYAAMQDPHLDIAMFAIYAMYDRKNVDELIDTYFHEGCPHAIRTKIYAYIAITGLVWSNWCEYKRLCGVEFGEYSLRQYRYAKEYYNIIKEERMDE